MEACKGTMLMSKVTALMGKGTVTLLGKGARYCTPQGSVLREAVPAQWG